MIVSRRSITNRDHKSRSVRSPNGSCQARMSNRRNVLHGRLSDPGYLIEVEAIAHIPRR